MIASTTDIKAAERHQMSYHGFRQRALADWSLNLEASLDVGCWMLEFNYG